MNDERRENLFKKLARVIPKSKRNSLKSALDKADDRKVERLEKLQLKNVKAKKGFDSIVAAFATAFGIILLIFNMVFTMVVNPIYQGYSSFAKRICGEMQLIYSKTANYGYIGLETGKSNGTDTPSESDVKKAMSSIAKTSEADTAFSKITDGLFAGCEYHDFKVLLDNDYAKLSDLALCRQEYNTLNAEYFSDSNYVNDKTNNYLKYIVELKALKEPEEGVADYENKKKEYDDKKANLEESILKYENTRDGLTEKYNALTVKYGELEVCLQNCIATRQLMRNFIIDNESAMVDDLRSTVYGNITAIKNYGLSKYLSYCLQSLSSFNSSYTAAMDKYSADSEAYSDAIVKLTELNAYYDEIAVYFQRATTEFNAFNTDYVDQATIYNNALFDYQTEFSEFSAEYTAFLNDYNENYENSTEEQKAVYDATKSQYENRSEVFAQRKSEIDNLYNTVIRYYERVLSAFGLSNYISAVNEKIKSDKKVNKLQQELANETDSDKIASINAQIAAEESNIQNKTETINEGKTKIELINEMLTSGVWTEEYYANFCVAFDEKNATDDEKDEFKFIKTMYENVQNALVSLSARTTEKQNIISQQVTVCTLPYSITDDEYNSVVAYYNTEHALLRLQNTLNLVPDVAELVADGYKKIIDNVDIEIKVDDKTYDRVVKDLSLKNIYSNVCKYLDTVRTVDLNTLLFDTFDISVLSVAEDHAAIDSEQYLNLVEEVAAFDSAVNNASITQEKAIDLYKIDYRSLPDYLYTLLLVIDILAAVIYACYFVYLIIPDVKEGKGRNYDTISNVLNN